MTTDSPRRRTWRRAVALAPLFGLMGCAHAMADPTRASREPPHDGRLRVVTYNVHLGEALLDERSGGTRSMEQAFASEDALRGVDILGLRELCSNEGGWQVDYFDRLMREKAGASWHAVALSDPAGKMMCARVEAIYSRYPIVDSGAIALPEVRQPRSAVWADIEVPEPGGTVRRLRVYNAHLENRARDGGSAEGRLAQAKVILAHLEAWRATHPDTPVLLLGDLNTLGRLWDFWQREQTLAEIIAHRLSPSLPERERTLTLLPHQTDWIFADGLQLKASRVVHVWLSDHFPVVADYGWPDLTTLTAAQKPE